LDADRRLELIALLAKDETWDAVVLIGRELLDAFYPADIFAGVSGDSGPQYVVALRAALNRVDDRDLPTADDVRGIIKSD